MRDSDGFTGRDVESAGRGASGVLLQYYSNNCNLFLSPGTIMTLQVVRSKLGTLEPGILHNKWYVKESDLPLTWAETNCSTVAWTSRRRPSGNFFLVRPTSTETFIK